MQYQIDATHSQDSEYSKLHHNSKQLSRQLQNTQNQLLKKYPPHQYLKQNQSSRIQSIKTKYQNNKLKSSYVPMKSSCVEPLMQNYQSNKLWNAKNVQNYRKIDNEQLNIQDKIKNIRQVIADQFNKDKQNASVELNKKFLKTQKFAQFKQQSISNDYRNDEYEFPVIESAEFKLNYDVQKNTQEKIRDFSREVVKKARQNFNNQQGKQEQGQEFIQKVNEVNERITQKFLELEDKLKELSYLRKKKQRDQQQMKRRQYQYNTQKKLQQEMKFQEERRIKQQRAYEEKVKEKMQQLQQEANQRARQYEEQQKRLQEEKNIREQNKKIDEQRKIQQKIMQQKLQQQIENKKKKLEYERQQRRKKQQERLQEENKKIEEENRKLQEERIRIKKQLEQQQQISERKSEEIQFKQIDEEKEKIQKTKKQIFQESDQVNKDQSPINNYRLSSIKVPKTNKSQYRSQLQGQSKVSEFKFNKKQVKIIEIPQQTSRITQLKGQVKSRQPLPKQFIILINYLREQILRDRYFTKIVVPISLKKIKAIKQELFKSYNIDTSYLQVLPNQMDPLSSPIDEYSDMSVKVISEALYNLYRRMQDHFTQKLSHKFSNQILQILIEQISMNAAQNNNKKLHDINIWTIGHLVSYINMRTGENFRNRDLVKLLRRMDINSMKFECRAFTNALLRNNL